MWHRESGAGEGADPKSISSQPVAAPEPWSPLDLVPPMSLKVWFLSWPEDRRNLDLSDMGWRSGEPLGAGAPSVLTALLWLFANPDHTPCYRITPCAVVQISGELLSASSPGFTARKWDSGRWRSWPCFCRGAPSAVVALGWCVENGEISALCRNSHNKLMSVLGPLCLLHQHLAQSVFLLPVFSRSSPFCNVRNFAIIPGRAVISPGPGAWHGGHSDGQEGGGGTEIPPGSLGHVICFPSTSLSRQEGPWQHRVGAQGPAGLLSGQRVLGTSGWCPFQPQVSPAWQGG